MYICHWLREKNVDGLFFGSFREQDKPPGWGYFSSKWSGDDHPEEEDRWNHRGGSCVCSSTTYEGYHHDNDEAPAEFEPKRFTRSHVIVWAICSSAFCVESMEHICCNSVLSPNSTSNKSQLHIHSVTPNIFLQRFISSSLIPETGYKELLNAPFAIGSKGFNELITSNHTRSLS